MTISAWISFLFIAGFLIGIGLFIGYAMDGEHTTLIGGLIGVFVSILLLIGMFWYYNSTAAGSRALKTQESNFNRGINRTITVYDIEGDIIQQFSGKFDIEYDDDRIMFDDENNLRHIIYYPTGTVIIDEIP
jgi:hypothetical protein